ncbi:MAG TPA: type 1 glutamine amidotransferase family protein [Polyangiaceae bacterium]|nr:type 1 glutamine amidotransferase family protein [Polyangiaceae bacterium]
MTNAVLDVHVLVLDTLADWEPGLAIAHINRPAPGVASRYQVRSVGLTRSPIRTLGGLTITPDLTLDELSPSQSSLLILPGADTWMDASTEPALAKARAFVAAGVPVAAICGATFGLARAGLLDERRHTGNDPGFLAASGYAGAAHYVNEPAVEDGGVITASAMFPLDFARLILARLRVFSPAALEAWYGLYRTGDPACYYAFMEALEHAPSH